MAIRIYSKTAMKRGAGEAFARSACCFLETTFEASSADSPATGSSVSIIAGSDALPVWVSAAAVPDGGAWIGGVGDWSVPVAASLTTRSVAPMIGGCL